MHSKLFAAAGIAGLMWLAPVSADAACCGQAMPDKKAAAPCCADHAMKPDAPCCADHHKAPTPEPVANDTLLEFDYTPLANVLAVLPLDNDPQLFPAPPVRQQTEIWFQRPVVVGRHILQGRYVIEHDNDRMARGEPCTHIYAYNDRKNPVVTFHCTHLERDRNGTNTAVLVSTGDSAMQKLVEFQFAGDYAAHGVPSER